MEYLLTSISLQHKYLRRRKSKLVYLCIPNTQHDSDTKRLLTLMKWIHASSFHRAHSLEGSGNVTKGYFNQWVLANKESDKWITGKTQDKETLNQVYVTSWVFLPSIHVSTFLVGEHTFSLGNHLSALHPRWSWTSAIRAWSLS